MEYAPSIKCAKLNHLLFLSLSFSGNPDDLSWYSQGITNTEMNTITTGELKAKAAEAAHAGHGDAIKARLSKLGVRKISELPEHEFTDFYAFLESLIKESRDA